MKPTFHLAVRAVSTAVLLAIGAGAYGQAGSSEPRRATVLRAAPGQALSAPSAAAPPVALAAFLRARGLDDATLGSLRETGSHRAATGITHVRMEQQAHGLTVWGSELKAAVDGRGRVVHLIERIVAVPAAPPAPAAIDERQALAAAMARLHPGQPTAYAARSRSGLVTTFAGGAFFHRDPTVTRVAVPLADGALAVGYLVETWSDRRNQLHHTLVGGDGRVRAVESRTANDAYNVFAIDPGKNEQQVVDGPGAGNDASPIGWLAGSQNSIRISGNNTRAYLDFSPANNQPDRGGTAIFDGRFLTAADLTAEPTTTANQEVGVQNLFFHNNVIHDILYRHGFHEAAGNFQADNFGRGGVERDPVNAEAHDGSGTDNANFATPPDGRSPRMQVFLWSGPGATHELAVHQPVAVTYGAMPATWGQALTTSGVSGDVVLVDDGAGASPTDGCEPLSANLRGKLALADRGSCNFTVKALNAQAAGAVGLVVANNQGGDAILVMGGSNPRVRIPGILISQNDGAALKALSAPGATARKKAQQPQRIDGALDADLVYHEYGHGLSWRMIGGMSGPLAGAMGEGMSDVLAFLVNSRGDDSVIAEYASSDAGGLRRNPYEGYPLQYQHVLGQSVHNDGEIYAGAMWRLLRLFEAQGIGRDVLLGYFVDGMNYTPSTPAFEDGRDGMLQSVVQHGGPVLHCQLIWQAFAASGIGVGAQGAVVDGAVAITPSTTQGEDCSH